MWVNAAVWVPCPVRGCTLGAALSAPGLEVSIAEDLSLHLKRAIEAGQT